MSIIDPKYNDDCLHWIGRKPCQFQILGKCVNCESCGFYKQINGNILIIEAGGLGSIIRTTTVSKEIKELFPNYKIQWLTHEKGAELLKNVPSVDTVLINDETSFEILAAQKFTKIINYETALIYLSIAKRLEVNEKYGYIMSNFGQLAPSDTLSSVFLELQTNDKFRKKQNTKSMQQILLETVGIQWKEQTYDLVSDSEDDRWATQFLYKKGIHSLNYIDKIIGFNIGTSEKLKSKRWNPKNFYDLAYKVQNDFPEMKILILAGPEDIVAYKSIIELNKTKPIKNIIFSGYNNSISRFISLVKQTSIVVSSDTFGMHVAIGLKKTTIALFGPQPASEVYLYGKGTKIKLDLDCSPCFKGKPEQCFNINNMECMKSLTCELVYKELNKQILLL